MSWSKPDQICYTKNGMDLQKYFFLLIATVIGYLFWTVIEPFALVLLSAGVFAIMLTPLDAWLNRHLKHTRTSAAIVSVGIVVLVFVPMLLISLVMVRQAADLVQYSFGDAGWIEGLKAILLPIISLLPEGVQTSILTYDFAQLGVTIASWAFQNIGNVFSSATTLLLNIVLFFIALYYLIVDREKLYDELLALSPLKDSVDAKILKRIVGTVRSVVFGVLILAFVQGVFAAIGMTIFGVPGALIWGAVTMLAALVPLVGSALVLVPAILYLFFTGSTGAAVGLLIWAVVIVGLADNILGPYLIRGTTHMHAFLVLISVLGGIQAFGYIGIIAGPTILAALLALIELYQTGILTKRKITPTSSR